MSRDPERLPKSNPWRKVGLVFVALFTIVLVGLGVAYSRLDVGTASAALQDNKAAAERVWLAKDEAKERELIQLPESDNGAALIENLPTPKLPQSMELDDAYMRKNQKFLSDGLAKIEEASKRKAIIFDQKHLGTMYVSWKGAGNSRMWVKTLDAMARYYEKKSDLAQTERNLTLAAHLALHVSDNRDSTYLLVRTTLSQILERSIREMIPSHSNDDQWLQAFHRILTQLDQPYDLRPILHTDYTFCLHACASLEKSPFVLKDAMKDKDSPLSVRFGKLVPRTFKAFESRVHERFALVMSQLPLDPYNLKQVTTATKAGDEFVNRTAWSYGALKQFSLSLSNIAQAIRRETASRNALLQSIEILRTHADPAKGLPLTGRYSVDLDDQPIRIKHLPKGWIVYSVWGDGVDDGGNEIKSGHGDVVVHLSSATVPPPIKYKPLSFP